MRLAFDPSLNDGNHKSLTLYDFLKDHATARRRPTVDKDNIIWVQMGRLCKFNSRWVIYKLFANSEPPTLLIKRTYIVDAIRKEWVDCRRMDE